MNFIEKIGLVLFMIGLIGALANAENMMFWFALVTTLIGIGMFLHTPNKKDKTSG